MSKNEADSKAQNEKHDDGAPSPRVEELKKLIASTGHDPLPEAQIGDLEILEDQLTENQDCLSVLRDQEMLSEYEFSAKLNLSFESFIVHASELLGADLCRKIYDFVPGEKITIAHQDSVETQGGLSDTSLKATEGFIAVRSRESIDLRNLESVELDTRSFHDALKDAWREVERLQKQADLSIQDLVSGEIPDVTEALLKVEKADVSFSTMLAVRSKIMAAYKEVLRKKLQDKEAL